MVSITVSKRPGADATEVGSRLEHTLGRLEGRVVPVDVEALVSRNYGETAREKVTTLKEHLGLAVIAVGIVIAVFMGWRSAVVVMLAVPITFAPTLFVYQIFGYTLNRVTLFALIFVTGIVIDDSIIVAENMERHFRMRDRPLRAAARAAVDEVGNPTILATLAVIAAVLPMAFVGGMMGPYMRPIPVGSSAAMIFSLLIAFSVTPWAALKILKGHVSKEACEMPEFVEALDDCDHAPDNLFTRTYRRFMDPLLRSAALRWGFLGLTILLLLGSMALVPAGLVRLKMLPFDNKSEFQVILNMPKARLWNRRRMSPA